VFTTGPAFFGASLHIPGVYAGPDQYIFSIPYTTSVTAVGLGGVITNQTPLLWNCINAVDTSGNPLNVNTVTFGTPTQATTTVALPQSGQYTIRVTLYPNTSLAVFDNVDLRTTPSSFIYNQILSGSQNISNISGSANSANVYITEDNRNILNFNQDLTHRNIEILLTPNLGPYYYWVEIQTLSGSIWTTINTIRNEIFFAPNQNPQSIFFYQYHVSDFNTYGQTHRVKFNFSLTSSISQINNFSYSSSFLIPNSNPRIPAGQSAIDSNILLGVKSLANTVVFAQLPGLIQIQPDPQSNLYNQTLYSSQALNSTIVMTPIPNLLTFNSDPQSNLNNQVLFGTINTTSTKVITPVPGGIVIG
jgi:hypothetical protein